MHENPDERAGEGFGESPPETVCIAGLPLAAIDQDQLLDEIFSFLARGRGGWLVTANLDFAQRASADPEQRALYAKADRIVADGAPLVWAARLAGTPLPERIAGSDLVWRLAARAALEGRSLYLLGGAADAAPRAARRLVEATPELEIAGWSNPMIASPPSDEEIESIRKTLAPLRPDLVYVAFGSPKQEQVIDALRADLPGSWMMGCGISLSFIAGDVARAPRWMQRVGLEWTHRLVQEPRRLAERYLLKNVPFALRLLFGAWRSKRSKNREI